MGRRELFRIQFSQTSTREKKLVSDVREGLVVSIRSRWKSALSFPPIGRPPGT